MIQAATISVDAALYRLNNPDLATALRVAVQRGVRVRLVLDRGKYRETPETRKIMASSRLPFRLIGGRKGGRSKLHHKFAIFDDISVATGSYNWTTESELENFENLVILRESSAAQAYRSEFDSLWDEGSEARQSSKGRRSCF